MIFPTPLPAPRDPRDGVPGVGGSGDGNAYTLTRYLIPEFAREG